VNDPLAMYLADIYTVTANLAGIPGISVPCGENHEKLPIGLQLFARHFDEATLLRVADAYEQERKPDELWTGKGGPLRNPAGPAPKGDF
jgi:aspartyl-tRNA(Asn)/glutamyl-tRNA(Gln) amidotransferase subunit A